ncbi:MAG TPA: efflux RND transporter permease subunit [Gammaproteobacteria bacterium]|nr:efflux RND transporter permease subunit [Gammaproteobacteria bacterium]
MNAPKILGIVKLATSRRVTIGMVTLAVLVFGFVALARLKLNLLPELSYPTVTVRTELPGAAPEEVENLVTKPIEEAVSVIKNVRQVRSVSRPGESDVTLEFTWGTNMDYAGVDVREKIDALELPVEAKRPVLLRFDPSTEPVMRYGLIGTPDVLKDAKTPDAEMRKLKYLRTYADQDLTKALEAVDGVGAVKVSGGLEDEVEVLVDQGKLAELHLSIADIAAKLQAENVNLSGGLLEQGNQKLLVRTVNEFRNVSDIANAVVAVRDGQPVYLKDVATVERGFKERKAITRINGKESVELDIYKAGDANTVAMARAVDQAVARLTPHLPAGLKLVKTYDQSVFISAAIGDVINAAIIGGLLAALVIFFFLRNLWATIIVSITIPVSVIATFIAMYAGHITLNMMSLGGISLAIGMLVDSSIVVLENISRHRGMGKATVAAVEEGTSEVGGAITASTLTTIAVFFPLVFVTGIAGQLFRDQSLTVTYSVVFSLLAALTLIPMLAVLGVASSNTLHVDGKGPNPARAEPRNRFTRALYLIPRGCAWLFSFISRWLVKGLLLTYRVSGRAFGWLLNPVMNGFHAGYGYLENGYPRLIKWALTHKTTVIGIALASFALALAILPTLGVELIPQLSQGEFQVRLTLPPGTPLVQTDVAVQRVQQAAAKLPGIATTYSVAGTGDRLDANPVDAGENVGTVNVVLHDGATRADENRAMSELRTTLSQIPGLSYKFERPSLFTLSTPLEVEVVGYNLATLQQVSDRIARLLATSSRLTDIKNSMQAGQPEIQIHIDPARAAQLGMTTSDIANVVVAKVRGDVATRYTLHDRKIDVLVRNRADQRANLGDIRNLIVNPDGNKAVPLSAVADVNLSSGPAEIRRVGQERVAVISANIARGDLGSAASEARNLLSTLTLPSGVVVRVAGQNEEMQSSFDSMQLALGLAIFLVYLVMAAQFESLVHPLVIMLSVPLALVGAVFALFITHTTISVVVFIGLIMLAGIVVNNAIVLIDLVNQLRARGMPRDEALVEAGRSRLRPIVMTMLTTTLGLLPMALGIGQGAEIRAPMAITVIGGILFSTLLTLIVIPVAYALLDRKLDLPATVATPAEEGSAS